MINKNIFTKIASAYEEILVNGRYNHDEVVRIIASQLPRPKTILDLASGTGLMVDALLKKWRGIQIHCEEFSMDMLEILKKRHPSINAYCASLETPLINCNPDLITISFNSINYITLDGIRKLCTAISNKVDKECAIFIDTFFTQDVAHVLKSVHQSSTAEKIRTVGQYKIKSILSSSDIIHEFYLDNQCVEKHRQYVFDKNIFLLIFKEYGFLPRFESLEVGTIRTRLILTNINS